MPLVACPFCFHKVDTSKLAYQCTKGGNLGCTLDVDPLRVKLTKSQLMSYPTFEAPAARGLKPCCPTCGALATRRACPDCHTAVPIDFVDSDSPMIGIVGSKGSGKSVLMTVLVKQLTDVVGKQFGAAVRLATDNPNGSEGVEAYKATQVDPLFSAHDLPAGTEQQENEPRRPLVILWQGQRMRRIGGGATPHTTVLSFVDTAGEDLTSLDNAFTLQYISVCDSLIVALDPFSLPGARSRLNLPPEAVRSSDGAPLEVIARITELLRTELGVKKKKKIRLPVAVAFTKIDAFYKTMQQGNPVMSKPPGVPAYADLDGATVHEHMRALLHEWGASDVDLHMEFNYANFRFFGVSALGAEPDYARNKVAAGGVQPHRVSDPLLWLMAEEGAVPSV